MLALALALLFSLAPQTAAIHPTADLLAHQPTPPQLIPYGSCCGTWCAATLMEQGFVSGVLCDPNDLPLWAFEARIDIYGKLEGRLFVCEYASNPALGMPDLAVSGQAVLRPDGGGVYSAVIHHPLGPIGMPIYPLGKIEGQLVDGWPPPPPGFGLGSGSKVRGALGPYRGPAAVPPPPGFTVGGGTSVGPHSIANHVEQPLVEAPGHLQHQPHGNGGGSGHLVGPFSPIGHVVPPNGEGPALARWFMDL